MYLDTNAALTPGAKKELVLKNGILFEEKSKDYPSGDGTVPYWSLNYVRKWKSKDCTVDIEEIPNAEHREILANTKE